MTVSNEIPLDEFPRLLSEKKELVRAFDGILIQLGGDIVTPTPEFKFHPTRRWRFDRAWEYHRVAVEIEGGVYGKKIRCQACGTLVRGTKKDGSFGRAITIAGGHRGFERFMSDKEKYNEAAMLGWAILRFVREDILGQPFETVEKVRQALSLRQWQVPMIEDLSEQETSVLYLIAAGLQTPEISERFGKAENTIRSHGQNINQKLCVQTKAAAVSRALAWGLIKFENIPWPDEADFGIVEEEDVDVATLENTD
jgi:DNA-binding CsgD family transcriptional regulator